LFASIKPENVLFTKAPSGSWTGDDGSGAPASEPTLNGAEPFSIKLCDFGLSRAFNYLEDSKMVCTVGSPLFVAPEILRKVPYTHKCDAWSMGVLIHLMITGRAKRATAICCVYSSFCVLVALTARAGREPFVGNTREETFEKILLGNYVTDQLSQVSEPAQDLISKLIVTNPEERWSVQDALQHPWVSGCVAPCERLQTGTIQACVIERAPFWWLFALLVVVSSAPSF
jgi:serine/threonine protein kinase